MKKRIERLRGMHDLLPETYLHHHWVKERLGVFLEQAGYDHVDSPILERSDLFHASYGQELWQNLYAFRLHQRELCLRPEYTASLCRLYLDQYQQQPLPLRLQYAGPIFRYEAPGRGRYRQHTQLGIELFGGQQTAADAEILQLACDSLGALGISRYRLELGHIGVASGFIQRLKLDDHAARLLLSLMEQISRSEEGEQRAKERLEALYPLDRSLGQLAGQDNRAFGEGREGQDAHTITSLLSGMSISFGDDDARREVIERFLWKMGRSEQRRQILYALEFLQALHSVAGSPPDVFDELRDLLSRYELDSAPLEELHSLVQMVQQCGVPKEQILLNLSLGRGVSYYTGLVFEIHGQETGVADGGAGVDAQLCGGGRYDRLVRAVGGSREVPACGFAFGIERLIAQVAPALLPQLEPTKALIVPVSAREIPYALSLARITRSHGLRAEVDITGHGVGAGLRVASKQGIRFALIVGEKEASEQNVTVRDLSSSEERILPIEQLKMLHTNAERFIDFVAEEQR